MSIQEINDFFVERQHMINSETKESVGVLCAHIKDNIVVTNQIDLMPSKDHRLTANISRIRITGALFVSDHISDLSVYKSLMECYDKQIGTHLMVKSDGLLSYVYTNSDQNKKYVSSPLRYINDVYPCFTNSDNQNKLCLGLRFSSQTSGGHRSFGRIDNQRPSGGVFDLTEDFINPKRLKRGIKSDYYRQMFSSDEYHHVLYLCASAKLIVEDDRFDDLSIQKSTYRKHVVNSLFQSGSMVIFSGELTIQTSFSLSINEKGEPLEVIKYLSLNEAVKQKIIEPEDGLYRHWFTQRGLDWKKQRVIFIGHNYSAHNSICWRLRISYLKPKCLSGMLSIPEGGRVVDIQCWDWGMAEIYWRHCFERLYQKVLFETMVGAHNQKHYFNYFNPDLKGKNTFYWQRKIVGVGVNFNSWKIELNYKYEGQSSAMIPPYYEQHLDIVETVPPFAQPLDPPIYCDRQFYYLPFKTRPEYLPFQLVNIRGQLFRIKYKEGVEEFEWTEPKRVSIYQNKNFSTEERVGTDLMVYRRRHSVIGTKILFYFELYLNESKTKTEELMRQWIADQNSGSIETRTQKQFENK